MLNKNLIGWAPRKAANELSKPNACPDRGDLDDDGAPRRRLGGEGGGVAADWSLWRRFLSYFANVAIRAIAGLRVKDATSGFKVYRAAVLRSLAMDGFRCKGFGFQTEVARACQNKGHRVVEYPIVFVDRTEGRSKMSAFIVLEALWRLLLLRWRS